MDVLDFTYIMEEQHPVEVSTEFSQTEFSIDSTFLYLNAPRSVGVWMTCSLPAVSHSHGHMDTHRHCCEQRNKTADTHCCSATE